ncbi:CAP domain-containing protein [Irregularibacter muris]|uniref:CAP domain-containing protein n=1 Tax=Irregularibacter muris TaxID=1796619 RepID=A0AAE3HCL1_9FIRM|nr:CAP domain-containing protein [Irregularibacter muris]MCR1897942.1 CAP domain-containing protein [Irregularibacter muris]
MKNRVVATIVLALVGLMVFAPMASAQIFYFSSGNNTSDNHIQPIKLSAGTIGSYKGFLDTNNIFYFLNHRFINRPVQPSNPTTPEQPSKPDPKPEQPTTPEQPSKPDPKPEQPTTPEQPSKPDPKPEQPTTPEQPSKPDPKPEQPTTPEQPNKPDPKPEQPTTPEQPNKPDPKPPVSGGTNNTVNAEELKMLEYVNSERAKAGVAPLQMDTEVAKVAEIKSQDMVDKNYFSHTSPTYGSPFDMMKSFGIKYRTAGENIAKNSTMLKAHQALMNSEGHRQNILNPNYTHMGIGIVQNKSTSGITVTQMFIGK